MRKREALIVFVSSAAILWLAIINDDWRDPYAFVYTPAERMLSGQVPYRDFFWCLWPGDGLLLALWFKLFGTSIAGLHVLLALSGAAATTIAWAISARLIASPLRWFGPLGVLATFILGNEGINHMTFAVPLVLAATWAALKAEFSEPRALASGNNRSLTVAARNFWFLAGFCAALAGVFSQMTGALAGLGLLAVAFSGKRQQRLASAAATVFGASAVLLALLAALWFFGALPAFYDDTFVFMLERYKPFHAGVGWGSWLPPWSMLHNIPAAWWPVWIPALALAWACVYVLPFLMLYSFLRWVSAGHRSAGHKIILFMSAAIFFSVIGHGGAMRIIRLSAPLWLLLAFELDHLAARARGAVLAVSGVLVTCLLLVLPMQWASRPNLILVPTPRGNALVEPGTAAAIEFVRRRFEPGAEVLVLPTCDAAAWLMQLKNPTGFDTLVPALSPPQHFETAMAQLRQHNYPPILRTIDPGSLRAWLMDRFKPAKFLDEFEHNPLDDFLAGHYQIKFQDGSLTVFTKRE